MVKIKYTNFTKLDNVNLVLFDGECGFCESYILYFIKYDKNNNLKFVSQKSEIGKQILTELGVNIKELNTIVFVEDSKIYFKSRAVIRICSYLNGYPNLFSNFSFIPKFLGDWVYDLIAKNRFRFKGRIINCKIPSVEIKSKFLN